MSSDYESQEDVPQEEQEQEQEQEQEDGSQSKKRKIHRACDVCRRKKSALRFLLPLPSNAVLNPCIVYCRTVKCMGHFRRRISSLGPTFTVLFCSQVMVELGLDRNVRLAWRRIRSARTWSLSRCVLVHYVFCDRRLLNPT